MNELPVSSPSPNIPLNAKASGIAWAQTNPRKLTSVGVGQYSLGFLVFSLLKIMGGGDHCAVFGCDNDRRYPERQIKLNHVGILRFYVPKNEKEMAAWERMINRKNFKVKLSTKVCSNHFAAGYKSAECWKPTLYMKGYENNVKKERRPPKRRATPAKICTKAKKLLRTSDTEETEKEPPTKNWEMKDVDIGTEFECEEANYIEEGKEDERQEESKIPVYADRDCQGSSIEELKRNLFIEQATKKKNCYRYTGLSLPKLNLVFELVKDKAEKMRYWKGSIDTISTSKRRNKRGVKRYLPMWDEYILTLVRGRRNFDVRFLADTYGISIGQVSRIYNTWIILLSEELSFLVPFPSKDQSRKAVPKRFKKYPHLRIIIDCVELFIQKPKLPSSQKITWSNYKHKNTIKLLVGITPNGIICFIPPSWTGMVSDKEIVRATGLVDLLEEGDGIMADKGFIIRDILTFKKLKLISPAFCRGKRLSARGTTLTRRVASLRSHVERYILKIKQFRILSGVIPLLLKPMLDRIIFVCAALANLEAKPIE